MREQDRTRGQGSGDSDGVFELDLWDGSITPSTGPSPTYSRASEIYIPDAKTHVDYASWASGVEAVESFPYKSSFTEGGYYAQGGVRNNALQSNNPGNSPWVSIGSPTLVNDVALPNPYGESNVFGSITANGANEGIEQTTSIAAASRKCLYTVYVLSPAGTVDGQIQIQGSTGGTPETSTQAFTANSTWQAVSIAKTFTASATGNIEINITIDTSSEAIGVDLIQLETDSGTNRNPWNAPSVYVPTTTTAVSASRDALSYSSSLFGSALSRGTMMAWVATPGDTIVQGAPVMMSIGAQDISMEYGVSTTVTTRYAGSIVAQSAVTLGTNTWNHYAFTWDQPNDEYKLYENGVLLDTDTSSLSLSSGGDLYIGWGGTDNDTGRLWGWISGVKLKRAAYSLSQIVEIYTNESSNFT